MAGPCRLPFEPRPGRYDDLGRPRLAVEDRLRHVGRPPRRLDPEAAVVGVPAYDVGVPDDRQPVADGHHTVGHGLVRLTVQNGDDVQPVVGLQVVPRVASRADESRAGLHPEVEDVVERVVRHQRRGVPAEVRCLRTAGPVRQQPLPERHDDQHGAGHEGDAGECELGEAERPDACVGGCLGDDDVDRAAGEQQHAAGAARERQRHQQLRRRQVRGGSPPRPPSAAARRPSRSAR